MATFLAWLYSVAAKVYAWFGDQWAILYAGAYNAWTWAVAQAAMAYNNARAYAFGLFQELVSDLAGFTNWAAYQFDQIKAQLATVGSFNLSSLIAWLNTQLAPLWSALDSVRTYASGLISNAIAAARSEIVQLINDAIGGVNAGLAWLNTIRSDLTTLLNTLKGQDLANLITMVRKMYADLQAFLNDPVGWILDMLAKDLINAIQYLIAWGLGATHSDLPSDPPWRH